MKPVDKDTLRLLFLDEPLSPSGQALLDQMLAEALERIHATDDPDEQEQIAQQIVDEMDKIIDIEAN